MPSPSAGARALRIGRRGSDDGAHLLHDVDALADGVVGVRHVVAGRPDDAHAAVAPRHDNGVHAAPRQILWRARRQAGVDADDGAGEAVESGGRSNGCQALRVAVNGGQRAVVDRATWTAELAISRGAARRGAMEQAARVSSCSARHAGHTTISDHVVQRLTCRSSSMTMAASAIIHASTTRLTLRSSR